MAVIPWPIRLICSIIAKKTHSTWNAVNVLFNARMFCPLVTFFRLQISYLYYWMLDEVAFYASKSTIN